MAGGSQNTVSQQTVPDWLQGYYTQALGRGQNLLMEGGPQYYSGQQVASFTPMQTSGLASISDAASAPTASQGAQNANEFMTCGALLNPQNNPYLKGTYNEAADAMQNQINSQFGSAGSSVINSLPVQQQGLSDLANQIYGGAYQQGITAMNQASALAPSIDQGTYLPGQALLSAGGTQQQQSQNEINAAMQQYNYNQQLPYNMLSWYSGLLGQNGSPFGGSSSTSTMTNNPVTGGLGGAAGGAAFGSMFGPVGTGVGAGLGALLGLFGG